MKESIKDKLESYARKEFGVELDKRLTIKKLEAQIKELELNKEVAPKKVVQEVKPVRYSWTELGLIKYKESKKDHMSNSELLNMGWIKEFKEQ